MNERKNGKQKKRKRKKHTERVCVRFNEEEKESEVEKHHRLAKPLVHVDSITYY